MTAQTRARPGGRQLALHLTMPDGGSRRIALSELPCWIEVPGAMGRQRWRIRAGEEAPEPGQGPRLLIEQPAEHEGEERVCLTLAPGEEGRSDGVRFLYEILSPAGGVAPAPSLGRPMTWLAAVLVVGFVVWQVVWLGFLSHPRPSSAHAGDEPQAAASGARSGEPTPSFPDMPPLEPAPASSAAVSSEELPPEPAGAGPTRDDRAGPPGAVSATTPAQAPASGLAGEPPREAAVAGAEAAPTPGSTREPTLAPAPEGVAASAGAAADTAIAAEAGPAAPPVGTVTHGPAPAAAGPSDPAPEPAAASGAVTPAAGDLPAPDVSAPQPKAAQAISSPRTPSAPARAKPPKPPAPSGRLRIRDLTIADRGRTAGARIVDATVVIENRSLRPVTGPVDVEVIFFERNPASGRIEPAPGGRSGRARLSRRTWQPGDVERVPFRYAGSGARSGQPRAEYSGLRARLFIAGEQVAERIEPGTLAPRLRQGPRR